MSRNKRSGFAEDLMNGLGLTQEVQEVQEVVTQEVHEVQEVEPSQEPMPQTQGKKGKKLKRINMAFRDENYLYLKTESIKRGITMTQLVDDIINDYRYRND